MWKLWGELLVCDRFKFCFLELSGIQIFLSILGWLNLWMQNLQIWRVNWTHFFWYCGWRAHLKLYKEPVSQQHSFFARSPRGITGTQVLSGKDNIGEVAQSCPTLCDHVDCNLLGFSVHGILQARILEWIAISFSRGSFRLRDRTQVSRLGGRCFNLYPPQTDFGRWGNCSRSLSESKAAFAAHYFPFFVNITRGMQEPWCWNASWWCVSRHYWPKGVKLGQASRLVSCEWNQGSVYLLRRNNFDLNFP